MSLKKAVAVGAIASTLTFSAFADEIKAINEEKQNLFNQSNLMQNFSSKHFFTEKDEKDYLKYLSESKEDDKIILELFNILKLKINDWKLENPIDLDVMLSNIIDDYNYFIKINKNIRKVNYIKNNNKIIKISKELEDLDSEIIYKAKAFKEQIKRNVKIANMLNNIMDENDELFKALS